MLSFLNKKKRLLLETPGASTGITEFSSNKKRTIGSVDSEIKEEPEEFFTSKKNLEPMSRHNTPLNYRHQDISEVTDYTNLELNRELTLQDEK